jgi:hypothetical protein
MRSSEVAAIDMAAELEADDPVFLPSAFWCDLNDKNRRMLEEEGLANFKRTVSQNYFRKPGVCEPIRSMAASN